MFWDPKERDAIAVLTPREKQLTYLLEEERDILCTLEGIIGSCERSMCPVGYRIRARIIEPVRLKEKTVAVLVIPKIDIPGSASHMDCLTLKDPRSAEATEIKAEEVRYFWAI